MELPKTEQELNDLIEAKVNEATEKLVAKHNGEMATQRKKYEDSLKKAQEQANMSAEERAQQLAKEENEAKDKELNELRAFKKSSDLAQRLAKEKLPTYFKNDSRLMNADETNIDKVIKDIRKEYEASLPKGATHSTVVQTGCGNNNTAANEKDVAFQKMGDALKQIMEQ